MGSKIKIKMGPLSLACQVGESCVDFQVNLSRTPSPPDRVHTPLVCSVNQKYASPEPVAITL